MTEKPLYLEEGERLGVTDVIEIYRIRSRVGDLKHNAISALVREFMLD